jgi:CBS domain-containing protein
MNETVIGTVARTTAAQFRHVPVVEESRLAGIVSIGDVMKWRLDEPKHEGHALTLEEAMAEAARRVAPHSPNSQYRPARAAPLISDHPIASQLQPWAGGGLSRLKLFAASREAKRRAAASIAMPKLASGAALSALVTA